MVSPSEKYFWESESDFQERVDRERTMVCFSDVGLGNLSARGPMGQVADACYEDRKNASLLPFLRAHDSNETP